MYINYELQDKISVDVSDIDNKYSNECKIGSILIGTPSRPFDGKIEYIKVWYNKGYPNEKTTTNISIRIVGWLL